jgi:preprotein translocase subunit SecG
MENVVLVIHLMLALSITGLVLLQRSEGGGLGMGGGGLGGLATPEATANILTRATAICAGCFFITSLILGILAGTHSTSGSIIDKIDDVPAIIELEDKEPPAIPEAPISE